jgi:hypothetical protein
MFVEQRGWRKLVPEERKVRVGEKVGMQSQVMTAKQRSLDLI